MVAETLRLPALFRRRESQVQQRVVGTTEAEKQADAVRILRKSISILGREINGFKDLSPPDQEDYALFFWERLEPEMRHLTLGEPFEPARTPQFLSGATTTQQAAVQNLLLEISKERLNSKRKNGRV